MQRFRFTTFMTDNTGSGFDSQIFTLIVGREEKVYTAHATYLCQSPVFENICYGHFQESQTFEIRLPEDEPQAIRALIQYFYTGRSSTMALSNPAGDQQAPQLN